MKKMRRTVIYNKEVSGNEEQHIDNYHKYLFSFYYSAYNPRHFLGVCRITQRPSTSIVKLSFYNLNTGHLLQIITLKSPFS